MSEQDDGTKKDKKPPFHEVGVAILEGKERWPYAHKDTQSQAVIAYALRVCHVPPEARPAVVEALISAATQPGAHDTVQAECSETLVTFDARNEVRDAFLKTKVGSEEEQRFKQFWEDWLATCWKMPQRETTPPATQA